MNIEKFCYVLRLAKKLGLKTFEQLENWVASDLKNSDELIEEMELAVLSNEMTTV